MINDFYKAVKMFDFIMIPTGFWQTWFEEILVKKSFWNGKNLSIEDNQIFIEFRFKIRRIFVLVWNVRRFFKCWSRSVVPVDNFMNFVLWLFVLLVKWNFLNIYVIEILELIWHLRAFEHFCRIRYDLKLYYCSWPLKILLNTILWFLKAILVYLIQFSHKLGNFWLDSRYFGWYCRFRNIFPSECSLICFEQSLWWYIDDSILLVNLKQKPIKFWLLSHYIGAYMTIQVLSWRFPHWEYEKNLYLTDSVLEKYETTRN